MRGSNQSTYTKLATSIVIEARNDLKVGLYAQAARKLDKAIHLLPELKVVEQKKG